MPDEGPGKTKYTENGYIIRPLAIKKQNSLELSTLFGTPMAYS